MAAPEDEGWVMVGYASPGKETEFGEHQGTVSRVLPNGCAFIQCPDVAEAYGQDAYVHSTVVQQCGLELGDEVAFNVHVSSRGMPQVSAPCWKRFPEGQAPPPAQGAAKGGTKGVPKGAKWSPGLGPAAAASLEGKGGKILSAPGGSSGGGGGATVGATGAVPKQWAKDGVMEDHDKYFVGTVKHVNMMKGFTMVECPDSGYEADVYCHSSIAPPEALASGDVVAFKLHISPKGMPQAQAPLWKLMGWDGKEETQLGDFVGLFEKTLPNGSGFLINPALKKEYGKDTYLHATTIYQCGLEWGDIVAFMVHLSPTGDPQVACPCWKALSLPPGAAQGGAPGEAAWGGSKGGGMAKGYAGPGGGYGASGGGEWGGGYGGGADAFVDTAWEVFNRMLADKGKGAAKGKGPSPAGGMALPWTDDWVAKGSGKGKVMPPTMTTTPKAELPSEIPVEWIPDDYHVGLVKHIDIARGLCYIHSPASGFEKDIYVHKSVADPEALELGDVVCFPVHINSRGQPQASAPFWKRAGGAPAGKGVALGEFQGQVSKVLANGSGFIDCADVKAAHGNDCYLHESVMRQCGLMEGNLIRFNVHLSPQGKPQASAPCWLCCSSAGMMAKVIGGEEPVRTASAAEPSGEVDASEVGELLSSLDAAAAGEAPPQPRAAAARAGPELAGFLRTPRAQPVRPPNLGKGAAALRRPPPQPGKLLQPKLKRVRLEDEPEAETQGEVVAVEWDMEGGI